MKKLLVICSLTCLLFLFWCFQWRQNNDDTVVVVPDDTISATGEIDEWTWKDSMTWENNLDEFNEKGEFEPKKFQDDDIDEVMGLLKELIEE